MIVAAIMIGVFIIELKTVFERTKKTVVDNQIPQKATEFITTSKN